MRVRGLLLALVVASSALAGDDKPITFTAGVDLVQLDVVVVDRAGKPVTGLVADDFEVSENGALQTIERFEPVVVRKPVAPPQSGPPQPQPVSESVSRAPEDGRCLLIFFDDVHVSAVNAESVRHALVPFFERELRDGDWVTIVAPHSHLWWTARTAWEHRQLSRVVRELRGQLTRTPFANTTTTDFDALQSVEYGADHPGADATVQYATAQQRIRGTIGVLKFAIESLRGFHGRKSIVMYSEGFVRSPSIPEYDDIIDLARHANVAVEVVDPTSLTAGLPVAAAGNIYSVGRAGQSSPQREGAPAGVAEQLPSGGRGPLARADTEAGGSEYLAVSTGGRVSFSNDQTDLLHHVLEESDAYYLLGYAPTGAKAGERHVKVRVRREGLTVRARERYIAGTVATRAEATKPESAARDVADATNLPIKVESFVLGTGSKGDVDTDVVVEVGARPDLGKKPLTLLLEARSYRGGEPIRVAAELRPPESSKPVVVTRALRLKPGLWQARVVVADPDNGTLGSAVHTFEVPKPDGLRVSTPILSDLLEKEGFRPLPRPDRNFKRQSALYCLFEIFGAQRGGSKSGSRVVVSSALTRDGDVVRGGKSSVVQPAKNGRLLELVGFPLSGLPPGDYALEVHVADQLASAAQDLREPFTIVP